MQWSAILSKTFGGNKAAAFQLLSGVVGLIGVSYGLHALMVERSQIPVCSAELLAAVGEQSFLNQQLLTVEVAGAVVEPGVWQLAVGARVAEAIEKAGGFSQRADRTFAAKGLNLADTLKDGQKIYVPFEGENGVDVASSQVPVSNTVSINSATSQDLETLPGIGETRAAAIIAGRPYSSLAELISKAVLTQGVFDDLQGLISL